MNQKKFLNCCKALLVVALCTIIGKIFDKVFLPIDQIMIYLVGAALVASRLDRTSSILFSFVSVSAFNFFFVEPFYTFAVASSTYWLTFLVMLTTSLIISTQYLRVRETKLKIEKEKLRNILLSAISHDLRTPLSAIIGASETICENFEKLQKDVIKDLAKSVNLEASRLSRIVKNLLDITSIESGTVRLNKQEYYIQEIIGAAILSLRDLLKNHQIKIDIAEDVPTIFFDGILIEQVITNLLENAAKYTPQGTEISIVAKKEGRNLLMIIEDDGVGISAEKNKQNKSGYGLGLMICQSIVKAHGGTIGAGKKRLKGAHFSFTLPLKS